MTLLQGGDTVRVLTDNDWAQSPDYDQVVVKNVSTTRILTGSIVQVAVTANNPGEVEPATDDSPRVAGVALESIEPGRHGIIARRGTFRVNAGTDEPPFGSVVIGSLEIPDGAYLGVEKDETFGVAVLVAQGDRVHRYGRYLLGTEGRPSFVVFDII